MFIKLLHLPLLSHFDQSLIKGFPYEYLQYRSRLHLKVVHWFRVDVDLLVNSICIRDENCSWRTIYEKVWLDVKLVDLARMVGQLLPIVDALVPVWRRLWLLWFLTAHIVILVLLSLKVIFETSGKLTRGYALLLALFSEDIVSGCILTGITSAANVLPRTILLSYMMFWGAILL